MSDDTAPETKTEPGNQLSPEQSLQMQLLNERSRRVNLEVQVARLNADLAEARAGAMRTEMQSQIEKHEKALTEQYKLGPSDRVDIPTGKIIRSVARPAIAAVPDEAKA